MESRTRLAMLDSSSHARLDGPSGLKLSHTGKTDTLHINVRRGLRLSSPHHPEEGPPTSFRCLCKVMSLHVLRFAIAHVPVVGRALA